MNTKSSVFYGWVVFIAAGGGAYYYAKRSVERERQAKHQLHREQQAAQQRLLTQEVREGSARTAAPPAPQASVPKPPRGIGGNGLTNDVASDPSREATSAEPAPTRHAPATEGQRVKEKSKYEASEVWRSKKGDRLSGF